MSPSSENKFMKKIREKDNTFDSILALTIPCELVVYGEVYTHTELETLRVVGCRITISQLNTCCSVQCRSVLIGYNPKNYTCTLTHCCLCIQLCYTDPDVEGLPAALTSGCVATEALFLLSLDPAKLDGE